MNQITRRKVLPAVVAPFVATAAARVSEIAVAEIRHSFENYRFRTPLKFGGAIMDKATLLNVDCEVRTRAGRTAKGFGSMPLGNVWAYPSKTMAPEQTLAAMRALAESISKVTGGCKEYGHPVDINVALEPEYLKAAAGISAQRKLDSPIPKLATLVVASPFDAAMHDAFGKVHGRNCYHTYGPEFMRHDLAHYLGAGVQGRVSGPLHAARAEARACRSITWSARSIRLTTRTSASRLGDGLPETLAEWIAFNGLTHLKIKLNGDDLAWDVERVRARRTRRRRRPEPRAASRRWYYSLDFNEKCRQRRLPARIPARR